MEDRSLDEFLEDDGESDSPAHAEQASREQSGPSSELAEESEVAEPPSELPEEPEPATSGWTPDGAACEACGETVSRLWDDDGRQVCQSCKEW